MKYTGNYKHNKYIVYCVYIVGNLKDKTKVKIIIEVSNLPSYKKLESIVAKQFSGHISVTLL